jgi:hypothetical protein
MRVASFSSFNFSTKSGKQYLDVSNEEANTLCHSQMAFWWEIQQNIDFKL